MKKELIIQFSGGIDSLYAAHRLAAQYDRLHLLTFDKGYLHFFLKANRNNVELLRRIHGPEKIVQRLMDIKPLFREMAVKSFRESSELFGNEIAWCVPCRASMSLGSIIYALENEIPEFTDGANWEQAPDGEKTLVTADNYPEFLEVIRDFAASYQVAYKPLIYDLNTRAERRAELQALGAAIDFNSLGQSGKSLLDVFKPAFYRRSQPMCLSGYLIHWKRNFFNVREETNAEITVRGIKPKMEGPARELIKSYFNERGLDLAEILKRREGKH